MLRPFFSFSARRQRQEYRLSRERVPNARTRATHPARFSTLSRLLTVVLCSELVQIEGGGEGVLVFSALRNASPETPPSCIDLHKLPEEQKNDAPMICDSSHCRVTRRSVWSAFAP